MHGTEQQQQQQQQQHFVNPFPDAQNVWVKIGPADLVNPTIKRIWTGGADLHLIFSEQINESLSTNPENYTITDGNGDSVPLASAAYGLSNTEIVLTPASPLAPDQIYTVTTNRLTDLAGRALAGSNTATTKTFDRNPAGVKVFIIAGQSNMIGRGESEKGAGGVDGAIGSLRYLVNNDPDNYGHLVDINGEWAPRPDVKIKWGSRKDDLEIGFGSTPGSQFGPELGIGNVLGDHYDEPILLIKTAWNGKNLETDFRSPRAVVNRGGVTGSFYLEMMKQVRDALDDFNSEFPALAGQGYQIAGFGWHQGLGDILNATNAQNHEANLVDFIKSTRDEFGQPNLPFSIASTSHYRTPRYSGQFDVMDAQFAVAESTNYPEFAGNVITTDTAPFYRPLAVSPANDWAHWNRNGETLYLIGKAIGDALIEMLPENSE